MRRAGCSGFFHGPPPADLEVSPGGVLREDQGIVTATPPDTSKVFTEFHPARRPDSAPSFKEVHLWSVDLHPAPERIEKYRRLLTPEEIVRAERFHFDRHRRRFIVRRGALRRLVGAYLSRDPAAVVFKEGDKGKPFVEQEKVSASERLHFNLSDSKDLALYAFTRGAELGVDVEILRPMPDGLNIAEHFFSLEEQEALRRVPASCQDLAFFNCWTRKEAYIKAIGKGLSEPLDRFSVTLRPEDPVKFVHLGATPGGRRDGGCTT